MVKIWGMVKKEKYGKGLYTGNVFSLDFEHKSHHQAPHSFHCVVCDSTDWIKAGKIVMFKTVRAVCSQTHSTQNYKLDR